MWRALVYLGILALVAFGAVWVADNPGTVTVVWKGYNIGTSVAVALVGVLIVALVIDLLFALYRGTMGLPAFLSRSTRERRRAKGMSALSRGMIAVGSGDPRAAQRHAGDAERLLGAQPLTLLLSAQAAQISGDRDAAERAFKRMTDVPETRVLGLRGLYVEACRQEDETAARAYAAEAARLAPSVTWANDALLEAQCADGDWSAATDHVERRAALGLMDKPSSRRQRAVLLTAAAQSHEAGEPDLALEQALKAVKLAPELVPAACVAGRLLARRGDLRKSAKIIEAAWKAGPHPDLAKVYLALRSGDSTRDRMARAETLARLSSWDPEARIAIAQTAFEARDFAKAREALAPILADRPTVRICVMMARIEEAEHGRQSGQAREWMARAARAPRDPAWIADGVASERWAPASPVTGKLDAFVWKAPPEILAGPDDTRADVGMAKASESPDPDSAIARGEESINGAASAAAPSTLASAPGEAGSASASQKIGAGNAVVLPPPADKDVTKVQKLPA